MRNVIYVNGFEVSVHQQGGGTGVFPYTWISRFSYTDVILGFLIPDPSGNGNLIGDGSVLPGSDPSLGPTLKAAIASFQGAGQNALVSVGGYCGWVTAALKVTKYHDIAGIVPGPGAQKLLMGAILDSTVEGYLPVGDMINEVIDPLKATFGSIWWCHGLGVVRRYELGVDECDCTTKSCSSWTTSGLAWELER